MRSEWVPLSASALVMGALALVLATLVNPNMGESSAAVQTLSVVEREGLQWLTMSIMYFIGAVGLLLGCPAVLTLFSQQGRVVGLLGVVVLTLGLVSMAGYAVLMVFFHSLVEADAVVRNRLEAAVDTGALNAILFLFVGGFLAGVALIAVGLFRAKRTARWVPVLLVVFVAVTPLSIAVGGRLSSDALRVVTGLQMMAFVAACTGIAMAATAAGPRPEFTTELTD